MYHITNYVMPEYCIKTAINNYYNNITSILPVNTYFNFTRVVIRLSTSGV